MVRLKTNDKPTDRDLREMTEDKVSALPGPAGAGHAVPQQAADHILTKGAISAAVTTTRELVFDDAVRVCAYHLWEAAGRPAVDGAEFWLQAERELRSR